MLKKPQIKNVTLSKDAISKLGKKEFFRQFDLGNIAISDFLDFVKLPPKFSQVRISEIIQEQSKT